MVSSWNSFVEKSRKYVKAKPRQSISDRVTEKKNRSVVMAQ